jgi:outer membrane protein
MHHNIRYLVLVAAAACGVAQADGSTFKFGVIRYQPHSQSNGISGIGIPPGADADVEGANTLLLTYEYELIPNVGAEFVLGIPPKIKAHATGSVAYLGEVLSARNVAPTLLFNYHFGEPGAALRPYLGLGINYTHFVERRSPYGFKIELSDSVGAAAQAGVDYALNKDWGLFASVAYVNVKSKLVATGATVLQTTIDFRPWTYSLGASFRF